MGETLQDGAQCDPASHDRVATGQNRRVNRSISSPALPNMGRVSMPAVSHPAAKQPLRAPAQGHIPCHTRAQELPSLPLGNFLTPFELKTYGTNRAKSPSLQAIAGKDRFRTAGTDFPFGQRFSGPVAASGAGRSSSVNIGAFPLPDDVSDLAPLYVGHRPVGLLPAPPVAAHRVA